MQNLDNDRIIGPSFIGEVMAEIRCRPDAIVHSTSTEDPSSCGMIACTARRFLDVNGYDEGLPWPSGCQDFDLIKRLQGAGGTLVRIRDRHTIGFGVPNDTLTSDNTRQGILAKVYW